MTLFYLSGLLPQSESFFGPDLIVPFSIQDTVSKLFPDPTIIYWWFKFKPQETWLWKKKVYLRYLTFSYTCFLGYQSSAYNKPLSMSFSQKLNVIFFLTFTFSWVNLPKWKIDIVKLKVTVVKNYSKKYHIMEFYFGKISFHGILFWLFYWFFFSKNFFFVQTV